MKVFAPTLSKRRSFRREPMMRGKPKTKAAMASYQKGGMVKGFKPCANCPSPAKCRAAGACAMAGKKK
jgi:hypothetical protein